MKKKWIIGIVLLAIGLSCSSTKNDNQDEKGVATVLPDEPNEVKAFVLAYSDFSREILSNGAVTAGQKADLYFQTAEIVAAVHVKNGEQVVAGQAIASLDSFKLKNSLNQAKDNLERMRLELQDVLIGQGYSMSDTARIPQEVMEIARVKSNYDNAVNQYALAEYEYQHATLYAPFDGVVANLFQKPHNMSSTAEPFCTIIGNASMEVVFNMLESELSVVRTGNRILVSPYAMADFNGEGRITEINPAVDKNGMVRVKASVNNPGNRLYDGMNVRVKIQQTIPHLLTIPKSALVLRSNKQVVFTLKDGLALWNYVHTGLENSTHYVILEETTETLHEGDSVIYEGNLNLAHETPVSLIDN
ncbi:MAG: efflux RND transporter periplasmic adaptor subunit [Tannerella sp.]|jgi:RND family efflux transporter MFP subunit|nr:efflux RND transporter periplasmic adaptor subunit [Tannerella sp.]